MKIAWRNILLKWKKTDGRNLSSVPKGCFPKLLKQLLTDLSENVESNLKVGFRKAGIHPINRDQVLFRLPSEENEDPEKSRYAVDKSVLEILKEMRYGTINIKEPTRKRKLNSEPGKSLGNIDSDNLESESEHEIARKTIKTFKQNSKKKIKVIPGKAVIVDPKSNNTDDKEMENVQSVNLVSKANQNKIEVKQFIQKLNNDLTMKSKIKTDKSMSELKEKNKEMAIDQLPVVFVDDYTSINDSTNENEKLLLNNYIDENMSSKDYLPEIEPTFSEFIDPPKDEMCQCDDREFLETKEEKSTGKNVEIISIQKFVNSTPHKVNLLECKKIPLNTKINSKRDIIQKNKNMKPIKVRRGSYFKTDADILKVLNDNSIQ
ncbi:unnamed protein product [Diatraea saccharalis]|uniref:Uncharacterized protein n=1 Tax=Diatraea saccharalis TaxID=40085 RepID=A0A9N9WAP8_9NEOP|nr:unnamed protein product [Diatraea saccharalis]